MKELFQFTGREISHALFKELVRSGKVQDVNCGIRMHSRVEFGELVIDIEITDPIPGAPNHRN